MVKDYIDLHKLNLAELNGVVNIYPWFGGARKELCKRMSELGEGAWSDERYADAALYICSRRVVAELAHSGHKVDYSDKDVKELLRKYIDDGVGEIKEQDQSRRIVVVGGDYFSQQEYESVRREGDNDFGAIAREAIEAVNSGVGSSAPAADEAASPEAKPVEQTSASSVQSSTSSGQSSTSSGQSSAAPANFVDLCTETLAEIYVEQGYPEQARQIYSRLSLRFPEKSAYFAALIEKLKK